MVRYMKFLLNFVDRFGRIETQHRTAGPCPIGSQRPRIVHQRRNTVRCSAVAYLLAPRRLLTRSVA